jgi:hypothetical protein
MRQQSTIPHACSFLTLERRDARRRMRQRLHALAWRAAIVAPFLFAYLINYCGSI